MSGAHPLAAVILAHRDPTHVRRLIGALGDADVFVHCDARTDDGVFAAVAAGAPVGVRWLDRRPTPWAGWGIVEAELDGLRRAVAETAATHMAVLQGADYPLAPPAEIAGVLDRVGPRSVLPVRPLPYDAWGRGGGLPRLRYRHRAWRRHMLRLPVPRALPDDLRPAGGPALKVLSRAHAAAVVAVADARPDLVRFFRSVWAPDETFVPSLLASPDLVERVPGDVVDQNLWYLDWAGGGTKSPRWLTADRYDDLSAARHRDRDDPTRLPALFARKFSTERSAGLLDRIDQDRDRSTLRS